MNKSLLVAAFVVPCWLGAIDQVWSQRSYEITPETLQAMEQAAPDAPLVKPSRDRKLLVYGRMPTHPESVVCCFNALEILGRKTGAFEAVSSGDPAVFLPENLEQFDAVVMNNTHERSPMLPENFDQLGADEQAAARAREPLLKKSLVDFVRSGKGLVGIHGATAVPGRLDWPELLEMYGGRTVGHRSGVWWIKPEEPDHPLCSVLDGKPFEVRDEIYVFGNPLTREPMMRDGLRVLLSVDLSRTPDPGLRDDGDYAISWIRRHGEGRVFYCALGHAKTAYTNAALLRHYLAGIQWAIGDLEADASNAARRLRPSAARSASAGGPTSSKRMPSI